MFFFSHSRKKLEGTLNTTSFFNIHKVTFLRSEFFFSFFFLFFRVTVPTPYPHSNTLICTRKLYIFFYLWVQITSWNSPEALVKEQKPCCSTIAVFYIKCTWIGFKKKRTSVSKKVGVYPCVEKWYTICIYLAACLCVWVFAFVCIHAWVYVLTSLLWLSLIIFSLCAYIFTIRTSWGQGGI